MRFRNRSTNIVREHFEIQEEFPNIFIPRDASADFLDSLGYDPVTAVQVTDLMFDKSMYTAYRDGAEQVDGVWQDRWVYIELTQELKDEQLVAAKAAKNNLINSWRAQANQTYFVHLGKQVACDALSRGDIDAVANEINLNGVFPYGFPGVWKAIDNTYISMDTLDKFKAMYSSMTLQGTINFGRSMTLKSQLAAATSLGAVEALAW